MTENCAVDRIIFLANPRPVRLSPAFIDGNQYSSSALQPPPACEYRAFPAPGKDLQNCAREKADAETASIQHAGRRGRMSATDRTSHPR
jgi:hypothetical protein